MSDLVLKHQKWQHCFQVNCRNQKSSLQTQHILRSRSYSYDAKRNSTVIVIITLKPFLNEKVGYHFVR